MAEADRASLQARRVEEVTSAFATPETHLIIGEDLTLACAVNAGVLLVRASELALQLRMLAEQLFIPVRKYSFCNDQR